MFYLSFMGIFFKNVYFYKQAAIPSRSRASCRGVKYVLCSFSTGLGMPLNYIIFVSC